MDDILSLKKENKHLKKFISLVLAEMELTQRTVQIKENFLNSDDSMRIIKPILERISLLKTERMELQSTLFL
ncbi:MAG: hypothetical protein CK527_01725 [Nitrosarchaeum sp.]|nr:hypothetical protein [Nitrosarchaeum sp.]PHY09354.1 MAG: hypothetical protein CK527_01725 [Nitrosarchaeum sp.]